MTISCLCFKTDIDTSKHCGVEHFSNRDCTRRLTGKPATNFNVLDGWKYQTYASAWREKRRSNPKFLPGCVRALRQGTHSRNLFRALTGIPFAEKWCLIFAFRVLRQFSMNPFYRYDTPIRSADFDTRVRALARRYL